MNAKQAAKILGCSKLHVLRLIRDKKIKAKKVKIIDDEYEPNRPRSNGSFGFYYEIKPEEVEKAKKLPKRCTRGKSKPRSRSL